MFEHIMKEKMTVVVEISDIEQQVFQDELLRFIYSGQVRFKRMDEMQMSF